ncbi:hypothetical protein BCR33DRAFT_528623 [Rhizoclosmatium globosum]|uniref:Uncharacterized protein n=1 Tax=Rhizoclosmatium globosum TaxID=329046 RepID=A0A1Y2CTQ2_9FUNG|nr:hypothetical protein BCR33DRAFT_528623 [Rhizoclosmatium globosum]|eukprot:ORY50403.1 hypothetical protein BCR33DRAFT_528623 [Rhizoclosmatium globosum]
MALFLLNCLFFFSHPLLDSKNTLFPSIPPLPSLQPPLSHYTPDSPRPSETESLCIGILVGTQTRMSGQTPAPPKVLSFAQMAQKSAAATAAAAAAATAAAQPPSQAQPVSATSSKAPSPVVAAQQMDASAPARGQQNSGRGGRGGNSARGGRGGSANNNSNNNNNRQQSQQQQQPQSQSQSQNQNQQQQKPFSFAAAAAKQAAAAPVEAAVEAGKPPIAPKEAVAFKPNVAAPTGTTTKVKFGSASDETESVTAPIENAVENIENNEPVVVSIPKVRNASKSPAPKPSSIQESAANAAPVPVTVTAPVPAPVAAQQPQQDEEEVAQTPQQQQQQQQMPPQQHQQQQYQQYPGQYAHPSDVYGSNSRTRIQPI